MKKHDRYSAAVIRTKRWQALRQQALRRDGFQCVKCGARGRLEVDHVKPVRERPDLAFDLANLQSLCPTDHSRKTRLEIGLGQENPAREAWKSLVRDLRLKSPKTKEMKHVGKCEDPAPAE